MKLTRRIKKKKLHTHNRNMISMHAGLAHQRIVRDGCELGAAGGLLLL
jgi:hypothetical protein